MAPPKKSRRVRPQALSPLLPALRALCELLKQSHRPGIVIGGVAASLLGHPRLTADVDATVAIDDRDLESFLRLAEAEGLTPRNTHPDDFLRRSAMLLLRHDATGIHIDINQARLPFEHDAAGRARMRRFGGISIPMPTPEDVIVMKAVAHRPKDLEDIRGIAESQPKLDLSYIRKHVQEFAQALDMPQLWEDIRRLIERRKVQVRERTGKKRVR